MRELNVNEMEEVNGGTSLLSKDSKPNPTPLEIIIGMFFGGV